MEQQINESIETKQKLKEYTQEIQNIGEFLAKTLPDNKILIAGNGGSAADAQHMAAELVGRFKKERRGLPAIALTTDTSIITAVTNDYSYEGLFSRQIEALGKEGDIFVGISTSGNSENIVQATNKAKEIGLKTVLLLGKNGGKLREMGDYTLTIPSNDTARIQESHILVIHLLCDIIEKQLFE